MLITARDIVLRLPDADAARIRLELSGNLCRCTGYLGIVRAISRVLGERRRGELAAPPHQDLPLGPVGARPAGTRPGGAIQSGASATGSAASEQRQTIAERLKGLAAKMLGKAQS
jgi:carbon-monoxide dehydrogenase small subunit